MNWCKLGIHDYGEWDSIRGGSIYDSSNRRIGCWLEQYKKCKSCGKIKLRTERTS